LKNGHKRTWDHRVIQKTFIVWLITPLISAAIAYLLLFLFVRR